MSRLPSPDAHSLFADGGETGDLMMDVDWASTPLGPVESWPASLRTCVRIVLTSRQPMFVWWGDQLINLYNDAYRSILGGKHPHALGQPASKVWAEIWDQVEPRAEASMRGNRGTYDEALLLIMERNGYAEETYYTFSYSPVPNERGGAGGILCANTDDTERILGQRRIALLRELATRTADARSCEAACLGAARALETNLRDLPFVLIYLHESGEEELVLAGASGVDVTHPWAPERIPLAGPGPWGVIEVLRTHAPRVSRIPGAEAADLPRGAWDRPPVEVAVLPITASGDAGRAGVLVVGLSPYRLYDEGYRSFLDLVAGHISAALANARAYEAERQRAEHLVELDRVKTAFFGNVSHEFRTPLTLMLGPLEDALASSQKALDGSNLATVHRNALRLLKLVNSLLDFARIEAGRARADQKATDLAAVTADIASAFRSAIERAGLRFVVTCEPLPARVFVDRDMWEKIVLNLVSNASKFTFEGTIGVSLRWQSDHAELVVSDTGGGIPSAELPHLFERFHRVHGARSRTHEGSGIGLALVHELVRLHGGSVRVESEVGRGTTFIVTIPRGRGSTDEATAGSRPLAATSLGAAPFVEEALRWLPEPPSTRFDAGAPPAPAPREEDGARVLLADDNADMRDYLARVLRERWTVEAVGNGVEALAAARRSRPDLVLTDVMMPGLDGFALLRELRADPRTRGVPVIMLSARAGEESRVEGLEAGADDYLVKPFSARELAARVATHLELARARASVEAERNALKRLVATAPVQITFLRGPDLVIEVAHPIAIAKLAGRPLEGLPLLEAIPEFRGQAYAEILRRVYETGEPASGREAPVIVVGANGPETTFWDFDYRAVRDAEGRIEGVMTCDVEVTSGVRAREALRENAERLQLALDAAALGAWELDAATRRGPGSPRHAAIFGSDARATDWSWEELTEHVHPDDRARFDAAFRALIDDGTPQRVRVRIRTALGEARYVELHGRAHDDQRTGKRKLLGTSADVTESHRIDEDRKALLQSEHDARAQAEEASRAKDEFLAMLGHELRNPLAPIVTAMHLLRLRDPSSTGGKELRIIERQVSHLVRLVDDLLDVSRIARGKIELHKRPIELGAVVASAIETASPLLEERRHHLEVHVPATGLLVDGDETRLGQAISNLLTNAAKYTPTDGRVVVRARRDGGEIELSVRDDGDGITAEMLPRVFDMFAQERQSVDRSRGGLGLGLAIVKNLVELHGGHAVARSEGKGCGSEFILRLPARAAALSVPPPSAPRPVSDAAGPGRGLRVLVVDDNHDAAELLEEWVAGMGYDTRVAHDGPEALAAARQFIPDVVLLDIGLPVMDGYEVARRLREHPPLSDVTLVAVTGYGQGVDRARSADAGFGDHLVKPIDLDVLAKVLAARAPGGDPPAAR